MLHPLRLFRSRHSTIGSPQARHIQVWGDSTVQLGMPSPHFRHLRLISPPGHIEGVPHASRTRTLRLTGMIRFAPFPPTALAHPASPCTVCVLYETCRLCITARGLCARSSALWGPPQRGVVAGRGGSLPSLAASGHVVEGRAQRKGPADEHRERDVRGQVTACKIIARNKVYLEKPASLAQQHIGHNTQPDLITAKHRRGREGTAVLAEHRTSLQEYKVRAPARARPGEHDLLSPRKLSTPVLRMWDGSRMHLLSQRAEPCSAQFRGMPVWRMRPVADFVLRAVSVGASATAGLREPVDFVLVFQLAMARNPLK
ncbi:hypothetical protein CGC20_4780 [Leishmania donovani]|uniref:Uncharacterized protein n=1 Tax=Leishmania donovani TaxID=5661 RepID=A0A504XWF8_LEIDO|nr:hypothetical protein CGC20_4780 [Leishmania donovani]